jgi:cob(I)alamin adenosyltransferase
VFAYIRVIYVAVCEEVCDKPNLFDDQLHIMATIKSMDDVRELIKKQEEVTRLEDRVKAWMKKVQEVCYFILKPSNFHISVYIAFFLS